MSEQPQLNARDAERIERALDGLLPEAELAQLQADITRDPALRAAYVDRAWVNSLLRADRDRLPQWLGAEGSESAALAADADAAVAENLLVEPAAQPRRWPLRLSLAATGIAAGLALFFGLRSPPTATTSSAATPTPPIATLIQAQNTKWSNSTLPTAEQSALGPGMLALVEGIATLQFSSGATVTLEAPTKLELLSAMHARLLEGSVTAEVPPSAHGFTIDTADLKVVDLGTRFGLTAGSAGNSHVFVFEGEVELNQPGKSGERRLTEGKAFHVSSGAVATNNVEPARFAPLAQLDGWTSIPTSFGRGKDAYVRRGSAPIATQPLLMVKHSELPLSFRNERRAFITFDLSDTRPAAINDAELVLDPEPSGMGFTAMVPDSRFALYGIIDEALDEWSESGLSWANAPATAENTGTPDDLAPNRVRRLAEFSLPRGASGAPLTIRSPELAAFLRADTNGLASLIIVRETGETDPSGLVHAFASKEHPTGRPPTLRVR